MKAINACIHQERAAEVIEALLAAGFRNIALQEIQGLLKPLAESEYRYWVAAALGSCGIHLSMVCEEELALTAADKIITTVQRGEHFFVWIHVGLTMRSKSVEGPYPSHEILDPLACERAQAGADVYRRTSRATEARVT